MSPDQALLEYISNASAQLSNEAQKKAGDVYENAIEAGSLTKDSSDSATKAYNRVRSYAGNALIDTDVVEAYISVEAKNLFTVLLNTVVNSCRVASSGAADVATSTKSTDDSKATADASIYSFGASDLALYNSTVLTDTIKRYEGTAATTALNKELNYFFENAKACATEARVCSEETLECAKYGLTQAIVISSKLVANLTTIEANATAIAAKLGDSNAVVNGYVETTELFNTVSAYAYESDILKKYK